MGDGGGGAAPPRRNFLLHPLPAKSGVETRSIDETTAIPKDLFERMQKFGEEAKARGAHRLEFHGGTGSGGRAAGGRRGMPKLVRKRIPSHSCPPHVRSGDTGPPARHSARQQGGGPAETTELAQAQQGVYDQLVDRGGEYRKKSSAFSSSKDWLPRPAGGATAEYLPTHMKTRLGGT